MQPEPRLLHPTQPRLALQGVTVDRLVLRPNLDSEVPNSPHKKPVGSATCSALTGPFGWAPAIPLAHAPGYTCNFNWA